MVCESQAFGFYDPYQPLRWEFVAMINGFFDDSGKESDNANKIVCASGYIAAGATIWGAFHEMWKNQLMMHNMGWLHMSDFMCDDSKEYKHLKLDWDKKKPILEGLSKAIKIGQLIGFGVAVDADAWRELPQGIKDDNGSAQEFCFMRLLRMVVDRMKVSAPNDQVSIMFDCDRGYTPARFQQYIRVREKIPDAARFLVSFTIGEPRAFLPLQAADLLAWETRKDLIRQAEGLDSRPEFQHMMMTLPGFFPDYTSELWSREELQKLYEGVQGNA